MLTLCMIVKNEEQTLKNCLSRAADLAKELVIVDTGSTDKTKSIALEFTDKVYDFKWCNDFAKARNFSISKASNDWVIVLDADEFIEDFDRKGILKFISNENNCKKVGRIKRKSLMEDSFGVKKYFERVNRVFNKKYFHYKGIIHEQISSMDGEAYETENLAISVDHIGYTKEVVNRTNKLKRNIDLLNEAMKDAPDDPYLQYQLGKSYYMLKNYNKASTCFEMALKHDVDYRLEYVSDLVETYGYSLIDSGRYSDALKLEKFAKYYANADFCFLMALIYMNNAKFTLAVENYMKCTRFEESKVEGVTSYLSYYNIGVIYDVLGFKEKALEYYNMCGNYEPAIARRKAQLN
ncbi:glycosyltransferase [Clostridium liquoris]|uniref:glycosyltransferase n=1 Tax=Clostridium liquoris TaxID=1289519 RepID=UPI001A9A5F4B|nr:glycosyltransferase family 2 protein [Clostridium liquoris]